MSNTEDNKMIIEMKAKTGFCSTSEDETGASQRFAILKWVENFVKKQVADDAKAEFWRVVSAMSTEEFVDKYFPSGRSLADFWISASTLEDEDFFPLVTSMFEDADLPKSPVDPETVYGNVSYERLRFVLMNHYYDLDAGAPFFARAHYDGVYANEFPVDYKRALEMLLRYTEMSGNATNEFAKLFAVCGEDDAARLLVNLIAEQAVGAFEYLAQTITSEIEVRVREKAFNLFEEYGLSTVKENYERGFLIDTEGKLLRYFGNNSTVIVPEGTTFIATGAFYPGAHTIKLPQSVVEIGDFALADFQNIYFVTDIANIGYGGLGAGPSLTGGGPCVTVYAPSDACSVAEYCQENDIIFVPQ